MPRASLAVFCVLITLKDPSVNHRNFSFFISEVKIKLKTSTVILRGAFSKYLLTKTITIKLIICFPIGTNNEHLSIDEKQTGGEEIITIRFFIKSVANSPIMD